MEATAKKQNFLGDNPDSSLILLTDTCYPRLQLTFADSDESKGPVEIDVDEYIACKGFKAKGKRLTMLQLDKVTELEPVRQPEPEEEEPEPETEEVQGELNFDEE